MRRFFAALILAIGLAHAGSAAAGDVVRLSLPSAALQREMPALVYLPDGYQKSQHRYPVLYLLHGAGGDEYTWVDRAAIQERTDRLIANGDIPPAIVVMPGCPGCWWVDGAKDKAETAFWSDVVPAIEQRFRTLEAKAGRLIAGVSAGGYGAVRFAMKYPAIRRSCAPTVSSTRPCGRPRTIPVSPAAISNSRCGCRSTSCPAIATNSASPTRRRSFTP